MYPKIILPNMHHQADIHKMLLYSNQRPLYVDKINGRGDLFSFIVLKNSPRCPNHNSSESLDLFQRFDFNYHAVAFASCAVSMTPGLWLLTLDSWHPTPDFRHPAPDLSSCSFAAPKLWGKRNFNIEICLRGFVVAVVAGPAAGCILVL